jgi:hypothetical protein
VGHHRPHPSEAHRRTTSRATDTIWGISPNPEGTEFGAASADGHLWIWSYDGKRATLRAKLDGLGTGTYQVAHHPTAHGYTGAGAEGIATYWTTDVDQARTVICATAGTRITKQEWEQYVPGAGYDPPCDG